MSGSLFRRCGCRTPEGKQYGTLPERPTDTQQARACPLMLEDPKHGRWSFRLSAGFDPVTKKRRQVNGGTYATKREAQTERNKAAVLIDRGATPTANRITMAEYLPKWLERRKTMHTRRRKPLAPATIETYKRYIDNDLAPSALGAMEVRKIRRRDVQSLVDALALERGAVTVARIVAVLQGAFDQAVVDELLEASPATHLQLPATEEKAFEAWAEHQELAFLTTASDHRLAALFVTALRTGLRRSELLQLTWDDVDLEEQRVRVRGRVKTQGSLRVVPLADDARVKLQAWRAAQAAEQLAAGPLYVGSEYVFTMEDGRALKPQYVTRLFETLRSKAGVPRITFHGLRHQCASNLIAAGVEVETVSKFLGHSNVVVTSGTYSHQFERAALEAANRGAAWASRGGSARTVHAQGGDNEEEAAPTISGNGL